METKHKFITANSSKIKTNNESIDLVITSPPYPMIKMWDEILLGKAPTKIAKDTDFNKITKKLNKIWDEMFRVLKNGGILAINMGDATRSNLEGFKIYPNNAMIENYCIKLGLNQLPGIIWSKPTNSPNKFLGSGMYPILSYITLEHEEILIFRKGGNREFDKKEMNLRRESAFFWEERNEWFSDIWKFKGVPQKIKGLSRERNAAYPIELPKRIIAMFSIKGDTILDPFSGIGTTSIASAMLERNSINIEIMEDFTEAGKKRLLSSKESINLIIEERINKHMEFSKILKPKEKYIKNNNMNFIVKTKWEREINIRKIKKIKKIDEIILVSYNE